MIEELILGLALLFLFVTLAWCVVLWLFFIGLAMYQLLVASAADRRME